MSYLLRYAAAALFALALAVPDASGQTLYQKGRGTFVQATPLSMRLGPNASRSSFNLSGGVAYRLTERLDLGATANADEQSVSGALGYTKRLSENGWGLRAATSLGTAFGSAPLGLGASAGVSLFRQFDRGETVHFFPYARVGAAHLFFDGDALGRFGGVALGVGLPVFFDVGRSARLFIHPSYGARTFLTGRRFASADRSLNAGFGVQFDL